MLVVDDDRDCLQVVAAAFKDWEVLALDHAGGLVERVLEFRPDVVVLDIQIGSEDGIALCRDLKGRRATSAIPVVFLSGLCASEDFQTALGAGGAVYVTKPLDVGDLRRSVEALLREGRA